MFSYDLSDKLRRKTKKLGKKDRILAENMKNKIKEIVSHNKNTIDTYKNLKSSMDEYKRIHLTDNYILLFVVNKEENHTLFMDIAHWDKVYRA
ncbi:MAG: type II toxin-antitoxin system RelE family toxin [Candidatus Woesearchaeota archaeon]